MTRSGRGLAAVAAVATLCAVLVGCVPVRDVPAPGLTDEEAQALLARDRDGLWMGMGLDDATRPPDPAVEYIDQSEWAPTMAACMTDQGFEGYVGDGDGLRIGDYLQHEGEAIAWYLCQATYQSDPNDVGALNSDQLEYMYDYNLAVLVPCLEGHGIDVPTPPAREDAVTVAGDAAGWNPYYSMFETFDPTMHPGDRLVYDRCRPYPPGPPFDGIEVWAVRR